MHTRVDGNLSAALIAPGAVPSSMMLVTTLDPSPARLRVVVHVDDESGHPTVRVVGLLAGPFLAAIAFWGTYQSLGSEGASVLGLLVWMSAWWLTIAVDLAITALLPIALLPLFGSGSFTENAAPYANDVIFLFAGGFVLSTALERHGLSTRFARFVLRIAGTSAPAIVAALMLATAVLSAFVSNTATTAAMLPIALALIDAAARDPEQLDEGRRARNFATASLLGVAFAASIGGLMTLIGSPPNAVASRAVEAATGHPISFAAWAAVGVPVALLMLVPTWVVLAHWLFPTRGLSIAIDHEHDGDGRGPAARIVLAVFLLAVSAWITRPLWNSAAGGVVGDSGIAVIASLLLFVLPAGTRPYRPLLSWHDVAGMPWGVLILFGGGLSLAAALERSGVAAHLAAHASGLAAWPPALALFAIVATTCAASQVASNTALAATAMPVLTALAEATGASTERYLVAAALGASFAFMLPVGTPPSAMVFATGRIASGDMAKAGCVVSLFGIAAAMIVLLL
jgi:sodium-dependent dicarboxylate transporter 2/3/5